MPVVPFGRTQGQARVPQADPKPDDHFLLMAAATMSAMGRLAAEPEYVTDYKETIKRGTNLGIDDRKIEESMRARKRATQVLGQDI